MNGHLRLDPWLIAAGAVSAPWLGWWALPAVVAAGTVAHSRAICAPRCQWYGPAYWRLPAGNPHCALTFDDGPHPEVTPRILDLLAAHQQRATFFLIAAQAAGQAALVRRMVDEGHALGIHSWDHDRAFALRSARRQGADLDRCQATLAEITGAPPPRLFRPPVGLRGPATADVLRQRHMRLVLWTRSAHDGLGASPEQIQQRLIPALQPRAILTLHDGHEPRHPRDPSAVVAGLAGLLTRLPAGLQSRALVAVDHGIDCGV